MSQLVTVNEATKRLQISRATFYRMAAAGSIQICKLGRKSFVSAKAIDNIIARVLERAAS